MLHRIVIAALIAAGAAGSAFAQDFFDFGRIPGVPPEPNVEVDLNGALLAFVAEAAKTADATGADAIEGLDGVRVRVYEDLEDPAAVGAFVDDSSKRLERDGWQRTVFVADEDDKVRVYVKMKDQRVAGMTVMVVDDSEAVFMNISGQIDPAGLGRLARAMGVGDVLGGFGLDGRARPRASRRRAIERHRVTGARAMPVSASAPTRPRRWRLARIVGVSALCLVLADCGILGDLRLNPGYAAFGSPGVGDTDRDFALSLGPVPLKVVRLATRNDPEMAALLRDLKAVRVYTYEVDGDVDRVLERVNGIRERLIQAGWQQVVATRDDGELVAALVKMQEPGKIRGMAVIAQDDEDLTLVNVIGDIRPENFGAIMAELDVDVPTMSVSMRGPLRALVD